jgi:hypothetical protein
MNFEDVDPSLAVGFLLKTREEFFKFIDFYYKVLLLHSYKLSIGY